MAATADKARFFLEQSIPELRELERKGVFTKDEISGIIKKRSDFEHKLNARGARGADFARYAEFEINLEALRKKRTKRLGIKSNQYGGNRRIFQVLDRATKKFHGDLGLWMQYLSVCRRQKAYKKINEIISNVIRMHPTKPEVWIYAASYSMEEQGDMVEARSYMQRGLRFCKDSQDMWVTYARLEMLYISKIHARQEILGLKMEREEKVVVGDDEEEEADVIALDFTAAALDEGAGIDSEAAKALRELSNTPALSGAIPLAIYDAAMKQFLSAKLGGLFFEMFLDFRNLPCLPRILDHVVENLKRDYSSSADALDCYIRRPIVDISAASPEFPLALATAFSRLKQAIADYPSTDLFNNTVRWITDTLSGELQEDIEQAVLSILLRVLKLGKASKMLNPERVVKSLRQGSNLSRKVLSLCLAEWPENEHLKELLDTRN